MCQQSLDKFANESVLKQKKIEDWKEEQERDFREPETARTMQTTQEKAREVVSDLPEQTADEKEFWQKRRQRIQLHKQVKKANQRNREEREEEPDSIFIKENELTPRNVLEHFDDIKYRLDRYPDKQGDLYMRTKEAFESAVKVLGYKCITKEDGSVEIERIWGKEKEGAQKAYHDAKKSLKEENEKFTIDCKEKAESYFQEKLGETRDMLEYKVRVERDKKEAAQKSNDLHKLAYYDPFKDYPRFKAEEELEELKTLWDKEYEGKSEEEKRLINRLFEEYSRLGEARDHYFEVNHALKVCEKSARVKWGNLYTDNLKDIYAGKRKVHEEKMKLLEKRSNSLLSLLNKTLQKREYDAEEKLLLFELSEEYNEPVLRRAEEKATGYARIYAKKEQILRQEMAKAGMTVGEELVNKGGTRFMMLIRENDDLHNQTVIQALKLFMELGATDSLKSKELGRIMKPVLQPLFETIVNYDVDELRDCSEEELEERHEELLELGMINQQLADMGKIIDPDDPRGRSIKEVLWGDKDIFHYKTTMITEAALRSRCNAMMKAYRLGCLNESSFTPRELEDSFNYSENPVIERAQLLNYIRERMTVVTALHNANQQTRPKYEAKKKALPVVRRIKDYNTKEIFRCPDEVLLEHNQELQDIMESMEQVMEDVEKYSIGEELYNGDQSLWILKRDIMRNYAARASALIRRNAGEEGALEQLRFQEEEQERIYQTFFDSDTEDMAMYYRSAAEEWEPEIHHEAFMEEMNKIKEEAKKASSAEMDYRKYREYGNRLQEGLTKIQESIRDLEQQNADAGELRKQRQKEQEIRRKLDYVNILLSFSNGSTLYLLPDQNWKDPWTMENFSRSLGVLQKTPAFAGMSDEEYFTMFQKLYTGYREAPYATPEEIEAFREENVQGLLIYKERLIEHTRYLQELYHDKLPSIEFYREHGMELKNANELSQLNSNMVLGSREVLDLTQPEDQKLFYDVLVTCEIGSNVNCLFMMESKTWKDDFKRHEAKVEAITKNRAKFLKLLNERPEEEKQKEQQINDRFRQLAQEATDILRRSKQMQEEEKRTLYLDFINRAGELEDYVSQNSERADEGLDVNLNYYSPEVLRMDQIKAWNHQVQKKRAILEERLKENQ